MSRQRTKPALLNRVVNVVGQLENFQCDAVKDGDGAA